MMKGEQTILLWQIGLLLLLVTFTAFAIDKVASIDVKKKDYDFTLHIEGNGFNLSTQFIPVTGALRPADKAWANAKVFLSADTYETNIAYNSANMTMNFPIKVPARVGKYPIVYPGDTSSNSAQASIYGSIRNLGSYRSKNGELEITRIAKDGAGNSVLEGVYQSEITVPNKGIFKLNGKFKILDVANKMCCK